MRRTSQLVLNCGPTSRNVYGCFVAADPKTPPNVVAHLSLFSNVARPVCSGFAAQRLGAETSGTTNRAESGLAPVLRYSTCCSELCNSLFTRRFSTSRCLGRMYQADLSFNLGGQVGDHIMAGNRIIVNAHLTRPQWMWLIDDSADWTQPNKEVRLSERSRLDWLPEMHIIHLSYRRWTNQIHAGLQAKA
ncbi:hypothetical protein BDW74DRAFT_87982 [Aspergillus multicolor]|uniref:uncharacterized protein n=1 Tax=Aspergillus multicolor TaxID=41759 RepID=UPI003CCCE358